MRNRISAGILALFILLFATSCEKWMDVQPRTKIKSDELLKTEQGYKDALIGCYALMKSQSLYGRELTFGMMDAAAGQYDLFSNTPYNNFSSFNYTYTGTTVRPIVDNIWIGMYGVIANVNNILDHIDNDKAIFTGNNYQIIKGEALAMRAFIHLDLLRLFASTDLTKTAIPYVTTLGDHVVPRSTGNQVIDFILNDLQNAATNLSVDPIKKGLKLSEDAFLNNRHQRLNYFAVKAIAARACLWKNDKANALANAMEVMNAGNLIFPWIKSDNISISTEKDKDYTFSTENLFALNVFDLKTIGNTWYYSAFAINQLYKSKSGYESMFEISTVGASDYRFQYVSKQVTGTTNYITTKFYQPDNYNNAYRNMLPLLRRSEMNYIAAECNIGVDNQAAINFLNEVRGKRGITTQLAGTLTATQIQAEILKEYRKEFQGEGQLFAYCKRTKTNFPNGNSLTDTKTILPLPDSEVEFNK
ncbi:RagB/SusD family nutrient uptake outer membrane protein [Solitalea koreensis]|nr:RagB/SusD family nutrient uptake outer membrane protein [Solitalea koreensis]